MQSRIIALEELLANYTPETNISARFMTRFEKTSLLGVRTGQVSQGSPTTLSNEDIVGLTTPQQIAEKELEKGVMPFKLLRTMPSGRQELWNIEDLMILD
jgi:DNA-directed RNA polymerase subunit K/omega